MPKIVSFPRFPQWKRPGGPFGRETQAFGAAPFKGLSPRAGAGVGASGAAGSVGLEVQPAFDGDGAIRARTVCEAGLTVDHRVADGADAARAFATMQEILEDPFLLLG